MEVTSVGSEESVRFGEGIDPELENESQRAAHSSDDLHKTCEEEAVSHDANSGVDDRIHGGFGSASLRECLRLLPLLPATLGKV